MFVKARGGVVALFAFTAAVAFGDVAADRAAYLKNYEQIDTNRAMSRLERLWRCEVRQTMSGKRAAAETIVRYLKEDGFSEIESIELPTDGRTVCLDNRMPQAWEATVGRLTVTKTGNYVPMGNQWSGGNDTGPVVADYGVHPFHLVKGSVSVPPGGVTAPLLTEAQFLAGADARGAILVLEPETWPRAKILTPLIDRGGLGYVSSQLVGGFDTPDRLQWVTHSTETASWSPDTETRPFIGFSVSPRTGQHLRAIAAAGGAEVKVESDGRRVATTMPFVTAVVPGRSKREFWLYSHIYEPLASDDSNGAIASIETARRFIGREKPEFTIRVLFGIEYYGYCAYLSRIGCPLHDRVIGSINLDSIPCQRDTYLWLVLAGPATPSCGSLVFESLGASVLGMPEMMDISFQRMGGYFDDYFISDPMIGVPMVGTLHLFKGTKYWHNSRQDFEYMDPEIYRRSLAFVATYADRMANPSAALVPSAAAMAAKRLARAKTEAKTAEHFDHLAAIERRNLADFDRVVGAGTATAALKAFDAQAADMKRTVKDGKLPDSPWRRYAAGIVPKRTIAGFTQDLTHVPMELRRASASGVINKPLGNAIANADGKKDLARLLREAEYESDVTLSEATVADYVQSVCFLGDWGYLALSNANDLSQADVVRALEKAGVKKGDLILVDADLDPIGHIAGGTEAVLAALRDAVGPEGTVLFPAFNSSVRLCGTVNTSWDFRPYDPKDIASVARTSPITAAFMRKNPKAARSAHLVRSWTGFGPRAAACLASEKAAADPYGDDSPIAKALALGGKFVRLGSGPVAAEYARYLAVRAGKVPLAPAVVSVRQSDGAPADVIIARYPAREIAPVLPAEAIVTKSALGLSTVTVVR